MKRPRWPLIAIVALVGCQQPPAQVDPFLYRSTIPPPATAVPAGPALTPGPQPYYSPPATAVTPVPEGAPGAVPVTPALPPVQLPPRIFPQRGGFDFPQSSTKSPASDAAVAAASPPASAAAPPAGTAAQPTAVAKNSTAPTNSAPTVIRIVEPPAQHVAALPAASPAALPIDNTAKPIAEASMKPASTAANTTQVVPASAELPLAASPAAAASAPIATSATGAVNYQGDHPGLTYGYDPGYKSLRGKLDYSVTTRLWQLHYLPAGGPSDPYGGSVVIADGQSVKGFEAGDFVAVEGTLSPPSAAGNPATYAISRIKRQ